MNYDYLTENRIQQVVISYPWEAYRVDIWEAYSVWLECFRVARKEQLGGLGGKSFAPVMSKKATDYNANMSKRLEDAKQCYLSTYAKRKLPQQAYQEFERKMESSW